MKKAIFTYYNFQVDPELVKYQYEVINKFNTLEDCTFEPLQYNASEFEISPDKVMDYAINHLFYEKCYDTIMILDVDCIPLSTEALQYTFDQAEKGILVGNVQRSCHIENNEHLYVAPSCFCISKETFDKYNGLKFAITDRGDIAEEYTYLAKENDVEIEMFTPSSFVRRPRHGTIWNLGEGKTEFGIGTTFSREDGQEMFFHLFESRLSIWNSIFYDKCEELLKSN
jgi:hypothetical protein